MSIHLESQHVQTISRIWDDDLFGVGTAALIRSLEARRMGGETTAENIYAENVEAREGTWK